MSDPGLQGPLKGSPGLQRDQGGATCLRRVLTRTKPLHLRKRPHRTSSGKGREGCKASKSQLTLLEPDQEIASLESS